VKEERGEELGGKLAAYRVTISVRGERRLLLRGGGGRKGIECATCALLEVHICRGAIPEAIDPALAQQKEQL